MYAPIVILLFLSMLIGLWRVIKGPLESDLMLSVQLFSTTGIAILLVLGKMESIPPTINIALCFALLAPVTLVAFLRMASSSKDHQ
ncbi:MAG: monovalent cation/H+ antiporter complex subunit F [Ketobacteraceae bacterium]|nr:monovalent cation/H+ antiporter complex subunit F [Ketobacteraceae bacterium]